MQRRALGAVIGGLILGGHPAFATDTVSRQAHDRRLLADCMTKRMVASRTISYNEAAQVCKDQMKSRPQALSANNLARPANGH